MSRGSSAWLLRDVLARIIAAIEELEAGDRGAAWAILHDLELDLAAVLERGFTS